MQDGKKKLRKGFDYVGVCIVFACHDGNGKYLFSKRSKECRDEHGTWDQGGGGLKFGETLEDGLRREIREEYCADVLEHEFLGFREVHREGDGGKTHWLAFDFKVRIDPAQVKNGEPDMVEELRWATIDGMPDPGHSQRSHFFSKYRPQLN